MFFVHRYYVFFTLFAILGGIVMYNELGGMKFDTTCLFLFGYALMPNPTEAKPAFFCCSASLLGRAMLGLLWVGLV